MTRFPNGAVPGCTQGGERLHGALHGGDRLVRFAPYEGVLRSAVVVSGAIEDPVSLARRGIPVEPGGPGGYVEALESGPWGERIVGRRVVDRWGRVPRGQAIVRGEPARAEPAPVQPAPFQAEPLAPEPLVSEPLVSEPPAPEPGSESPETAGAGNVVERRVPIEFFRLKFAEFVTERKQPLVTVRIHDNVVHVTFAKDLAEMHHMKPKAFPLGHLEADLPWLPNPDITIKDLNSTRLAADALIVNEPRAPRGKTLALTLDVSFETKGTELQLNNFGDIDLQRLEIHVELALLRATAGARGVIGFAPRVRADVKATLNWGPDGIARDKVRSTLERKLEEGLRHPKVHAEVSRALTRWLVGGEWDVRRVALDGTHLVVAYVEPPRDELAQVFPERPQKPLAAGNLSKIDHIVVLMMENRSFDHMLGYLKLTGARRDVDGLTGKEENTYKGRTFRPFHLTDTVFDVDPCHDRDCVQTQVANGTMGGFVARFAASLRSGKTDPGEIMGYYDAKDLPVYDALAREFVVCDRWFASHPGPTFPNRFYAVTGRLGRDQFGNTMYRNPDMVTYAPSQTRTLFDHLGERNVTWRYYEHGYCFLRLFHRWVDDVTHIRPSKEFFQAAAAGTLPSVSYIDPDFIEYPPANDDHAPSDVRDGQRLIGRIVNALMKGPKWSKTLLLITYDEHGGFYDHVVPPPAVDVSGVNEYGVRIPSFVVSPLVQRGTVSHTVFDHTSMIKTIIRRFCGANPPDMGDRVAKAADFGILLTRARARSDIPAIPVPPPSSNPPKERVTEEIDAADATSLRDFHKLLAANRMRHRKPSIAAGAPAPATPTMARAGINVT